MSKTETMSAQFGYSFFLHVLVLIQLLTIYVDTSAPKKWSWEGLVIQVTMKEAVPQSRQRTKPQELKKEHSEGGSSGESLMATHTNIGTSGEKILGEVRPSQNTRTGTLMPQQSASSNPLFEQSPPVTYLFPLLSSKAADTAGAAELRSVKEALVVIIGETKPNEKEPGLIMDHKPQAEKLSVVLLIAPTEPLWIEISLRESSPSDILVRLMRKSYPGADRKMSKEKEQAVEIRNETASSAQKGDLRKVFSVPGITRGGYTLIIKNKGDATCVADVAFHFFDGQRKVRVKEYKTASIGGSIGAKFRFIYPDAIFWDDDDRFEGSIEDSGAITKFNDEKGLLWKEEKEY